MPLKKKGKVSKLARMSDEERARYLQHRADLELEARRRKQQLIALFAKNKLKREEAFARINTAKINEQWRTSLRKMKCIELKDEVKHLCQDFEEQLRTKDDLIKKLYDELVDADFDHRRFQEAHMMVLDEIIERGKERINYLHNNYTKAVEKVRTVDLEDLKYHKLNMKDSIFQLKTIIFARSKSIEKELSELQTKNAINIHSIVHSKEESIQDLRRNIYPKLERLWQELNDTITNYERSTEAKRKHYECLKELDNIHQNEVSLFPRTFAQLRETAECLRKNSLRLSQDSEETIESMRLQSELLARRLQKMRLEIKTCQSLDSMQLKRLSVLSAEVIKNLEKIVNKAEEIQVMAKLCSDLEPDSLKIKKYSLKHLGDSTTDLMKLNEEPFGFLRKIEGFRYNVCCIKEDNILLKQKRNHLIEENNRLKHYLRTYLSSVSRIPTIRPRTRA
ncbi:coiled-coil domain-containing protein 65 [Copidosoma floridanum]|uniref:coiled-coil domain-containing protein 65 n=1 Tax=Copidosoma floridanum TaxID=29053 RepID=UPI0006C9A1F1|nr:coiled-coil domain-containing protein 65 [Copidosoma floridanum]